MQRAIEATDDIERRQRFVGILCALMATAALSQFYRSSNAVIAPELIRDLGLTPQWLGLANGAFFVALLVAQLPLGLMFDRIGVRRSIAALSIPMVAGALLHVLATTGPMLALARFLVGLGCCGSFMCAVVLVPRWQPRAQWSTTLGLVFGVSQAGYFLAGWPLAWAAETIGWRNGFLWIAWLSAFTGIGFYLAVRDFPDGQEPPPLVAADDARLFTVLWRILMLPDMLKLFALFAVAYPTMVAIAGLWAGPYFRDVYGLEPGARGIVFTAVAVALVAGNLVIGPLDRLVRRPKLLVMGNAAISVLAFGLWAALPAPPLWLAITLLLVICVTTSYGPILLSQIRSRIPEALAGRGATTGNMFQLSGAALLPIVTGFIPPMFAIGADGAYAVEAYRAMFGLLALVLAVGLCIYAGVRDGR